jgi:hypothetical protein
MLTVDGKEYTHLGRKDRFNGCSKFKIFKPISSWYVSNRIANSLCVPSLISVVVALPVAAHLSLSLDCQRR